MKLKEIDKLLPFGVAGILICFSIIQVLLTPNTVDDNGQSIHYVLGDSVIYGSFGMIIVLIFIIQGKNYWKHAFGILLLLAFTPIVKFCSYSFFFFNIELITLTLFVFHLAFNSEILFDLLDVFEKSDEEKAKDLEDDIKHFEKKFATKDKRELERIVNENFLVPEAVEAARRLLKEK